MCREAPAGYNSCQTRLRVRHRRTARGLQV